MGKYIWLNYIYTCRSFTRNDRWSWMFILTRSEYSHSRKIPGESKYLSCTSERSLAKQCWKALDRLFMIVINREKGNHTEASIVPSRAMLKVSNCFYTMTFVQKPFYVRCVKPNDIKSSTTFDDKRVGHQVRGNVIAKRFVGCKQRNVTG